MSSSDKAEIDLEFAFINQGLEVAAGYVAATTKGFNEIPSGQVQVRDAIAGLRSYLALLTRETTLALAKLENRIAALENPPLPDSPNED